MRGVCFILLVLIVFCPSVALADFSYLWCDNADKFSAVVDPNTGAVEVLHEAAIYNCCPDPAIFEITAENQVLRIVETVGESMPCDCYCCFDLSVVVNDLAAGPWTLVYVWYDLEIGASAEHALPFVVPEIVTGLTPVLGTTYMSDCKQTSGVQNGDEVDFSWGWIKGLYR